MRFKTDVIADNGYRENAGTLLASAEVDYDRGDLVRMGALDDETDELLDPFAAVGLVDDSELVPTAGDENTDDDDERADLEQLLADAGVDVPDDASLEDLRRAVDDHTSAEGTDAAAVKAALIAEIGELGGKPDARLGVDKLEAMRDELKAAAENG